MQEVKTSTPATKQQAHQGLTTRSDTWWLEPLLVGLGFACFIVYGTFRAFENSLYEVGPYLSPFYSPKLVLTWWHFSPAFLILWIPGGFRATCYYYRKAYYRAFFWDPPACSVGHMGGEHYGGETSFPLKLQNMHRYFFYLASVVLVFLWIYAVQACFYKGGFHLSIVSIIMLVNCTFLSGYSMGCHACRHLVGGRLDCFSCPSAKQQYSAWQFVTKLNEHHQLWAWISLFSVGFTDFYIRQVAAGVFPEGLIF
jgi:hypothetical protein